MAWREQHNLTVEEQTAHEAKWGRYNDYPPGWRKLTQKQFAQSLFFTFSPVLVEYRQMLHRSMRHEPAVSAHLYFMHDNSGFSIVADYWKGTVNYYAFGCDKPHQNRTMCEKCGFVANYDSSG